MNYLPTPIDRSETELEDLLRMPVAIADYIERFYNPARRHSALGYLTPNEFEDLHSTKPLAT